MLELGLHHKRAVSIDGIEKEMAWQFSTELATKAATRYGAKGVRSNALVRVKSGFYLTYEMSGHMANLLDSSCVIKDKTIFAEGFKSFYPISHW